jgi:hypothetical protein
MTTPQDPPIGEPAEPVISTETPEESGTSGGDDPTSAPSTHYASLEEADAAARRFQGEADRAKAALEKAQAFSKLSEFGDAEQLYTFVQGMIPIIQRPDFEAYRDGNLAAPTSEPVEDYRSDEEKRIEAMEKTQRETQMATRAELVGLRFERAEQDMIELVGEELWEAKKPALLNQVQQMARNGALADPQLVNGALLQRLLFSSLGDVDETKTTITKLAARWEGERVGRENTLTTDAPNPERPGTSPELPAKNLAEAWARGKRDLEEKGRVP